MSYKPRFISRICSVKISPYNVFMGVESNYKIRKYCMFDRVARVYYTQTKKHLRQDMDDFIYKMNIIAAELISYNDELSNYLGIEINTINDADDNSMALFDADLNSSHQSQ